MSSLDPFFEESLTLFVPTDLTLVNFDDPIRSADLLRAALQVLKHGFPAEHTPVIDRMVTAVMFVFDLGGQSRVSGCTS